jgi:hypothetical protein
MLKQDTIFQGDTELLRLLRQRLENTDVPDRSTIEDQLMPEPSMAAAYE